MSLATPPPPGRALPSPFVAVVGYTLRACLPARRWWGVLLPCLAALLFGWIGTLIEGTRQAALADVAEQVAVAGGRDPCRLPGSVVQLHLTEHEKLPKAVGAVEDRGSGCGPSSLSGP